MPDKDGKLTPEERSRAVDWLSERGVKAKCPSCDPGHLQLIEFVTRLSIYTPGAFRVGGPEIPSIVLVCNHCGYTQLHNAIVSGVVQNDENPEDGK